MTHLIRRTHGALIGLRGIAAERTLPGARVAKEVGFQRAARGVALTRLAFRRLARRRRPSPRRLWLGRRARATPVGWPGVAWARIDRHVPALEQVNFLWLTSDAGK